MAVGSCAALLMLQMQGSVDIQSACCAVFVHCINCSALLVSGRWWGARLSMHCSACMIRAHMPIGLLQPVLGSCLLAMCSIFDLTMQAY